MISRDGAQEDSAPQGQPTLQHLSDQIRDLRGEVAQVQDVLLEQVESTRTSIRQNVADNARETVHLVESTMLLMAKAPQFESVMPPLGGFAMDARAMLHLATLVEEHKPRRILELGGGSSTVWLGYLTRDFDTEIVSIDHLEDYRNTTSEYVDRHGFSERVDCRLGPLEKQTVGDETYSWYTPHVFNDVTDIDILLIDGPPRATGRLARYPALPKLHHCLRPDGLVLLDDMQRKEEQNILEIWLSQFDGLVQHDKKVSRLGVLAASGTMLGKE